MLTENERKLLLEIARKSLKEHFEGRKFVPGDLPESLQKERGAFVTLKKEGRLRGCIGYVRAIKPLAQAVADLAVDSAVHDPRFPPLASSEIGDVDIQISAMTALEKIEDVNVIEVGKHGLYMKSGGYAGLLLPQVATEWGWDRDKFLAQTCLKAGLGPDAWKKAETEIYIFSAEVFGEAKQ